MAYLKLYEHFNQVINEEVFVSFVIVTLFHYFLHNFSFSAREKRSEHWSEIILPFFSICYKNC